MAAVSVRVSRAPVPDEGAAALEELVAETMLFLHGAARREGLTLVQLVALKLVGAQGSLSPSELSELLGISRPAVTSSINILEGGGWVVRSHEEGDRRRLRTTLTARSRRVLRSLATERRRFLEAGLREIDAADRAQFARITTALVSRLRASHGLVDPARGD